MIREIFIYEAGGPGYKPTDSGYVPEVTPEIVPHEIPLRKPQVPEIGNVGDFVRKQPRVDDGRKPILPFDPTAPIVYH